LFGNVTILGYLTKLGIIIGFTLFCVFLSVGVFSKVEKIS